MPAWRRWHQLVCNRYGVGSPDAGDVIQPLTIAPPAAFDSVASPLARYLQTMYADRIPQWLPLPAGPFKDTLYIPSGASLATGYKLFLRSLKSTFQEAQTPAQRLAIDHAADAAQTARELLDRFDDNTLSFWELWKARHPDADRAIWERDQRIAEKRRPLKDDRDMTLAEYLRCLADAGGAEAQLLAEQQIAMDDPTQQYRLPISPMQLRENPEGWDRFYRQEFREDFAAFREAPGGMEALDINEATSSSQYLETRWNASGSVSFLGLFRAGGLSAEGKDIEEHFKADTTNVQVSFDNIQEFTIARGAWYDEQIIRRYLNKVKPDAFWGPNGALNLIPRSVIVVRGMKMHIACTSQTLDRIEHHLSGSADAGFWCGWFRVGAAAGGGRDEVNIQRDNAGSVMTLSLKDPKSCQVLAIRSWRPLDMLGQRLEIEPGHKLANLLAQRQKDAVHLLSSVRARVLGEQANLVGTDEDQVAIK